MTRSGNCEETSVNWGETSVTAGSVSVGVGSGLSGSAVIVGSAVGFCVAGGMVSIPTSKVLQPATRMDADPTNNIRYWIDFLIFIINTMSLIIYFA